MKKRVWILISSILFFSSKIDLFLNMYKINKKRFKNADKTQCQMCKVYNNHKNFHEKIYFFMKDIDKTRDYMYTSIKFLIKVKRENDMENGAEKAVYIPSGR